MTGRNVFWLVVYYCVVIGASWYLTYDGPPVRQVIWYRVARGSQLVARNFGRVGIFAESHYFDELEKTRG